MQLSNLKIATKIGVSFSAILLIVITLGLFALSQINGVASNEEQIATNNLPSIQIAGQINELIESIRRYEARHVLAADDKDMDEMESSIATARKQLVDLEPAATALFNSETESRAWNDFRTHRDSWYAAWEPLRPLSRKSSESQEAMNVAAKEFNGTSRANFNLARKDLQDLIDYNKKVAETTWASAQQTVHMARILVVAAMLFAVAISVILGLLVSRAIARPITEAVGVADAIAMGDMTGELHIQGSDEPAQLLRALNSMRTNLLKVITAVRQGSEGVATASAQIAQGNQDLSGRTESQASALEETAASMEELSSQVKHNADNAAQANQLASNASQVAGRGGEVVGRVVTTMKEINDSSRKISDIISVIDGIAFQTNILALNAAVEAARAGEQGRGFAVVASEVRSLAGRSAEAAKEIKTLINASVERVEIGTALVDEAGTTMSEVVTSIKKVSDLVGEISSASNEQALGVAQVGEAVAQMDQTTQQNAALVEEMAAAASSLNGQAQELVQSVSVFKTDAGTVASGFASSRASVRVSKKSAPLPRAGERRLPPARTPNAAAKAAPKAPTQSATPPKLIAKDSSAGSNDEWETF